MLDDANRMKSLDTKGMLATVGAMSEHLSDGLKRGRKAGPPRDTPDSVVVCGLGGSAIGGDVLKAWLSTATDIPCEVVRGYSLQRHIARGALVIVASYSGNTEETLSMFEDARRRTSRIVSISSGGKLEDQSRSLGVPHVRVPPGLVPRASFGYVLGALLGVAERVGIASTDGQLTETKTVLAEINKVCSPAVPTQDNPAKRMAHELHGTVPVFIGNGMSVPLAKRWANQFNENAKSIAFSSELPEMDHNEIMFWASDPRSQGFSAVFLVHGAEDGRMGRRVEATREMVCERARAHVVRAAGNGPMAKMLSLAATGDYVSLYSAMLNGHDPSTTAPIESLKMILSKK